MENDLSKRLKDAAKEEFVNKYSNVPDNISVFNIDESIYRTKSPKSKYTTRRIRT